MTFALLSLALGYLWALSLHPKNLGRGENTHTHQRCAVEPLAPVPRAPVCVRAWLEYVTRRHVRRRSHVWAHGEEEESCVGAWLEHVTGGLATLSTCCAV
jgi:hypothetical protein